MNDPATPRKQTEFPVVYHKRSECWLSGFLGDQVQAPNFALAARIEELARETNGLGPQPLWSGYSAVEKYPKSSKKDRISNDVRTGSTMGRIFSKLASSISSPVIIEFGTAFGVSGMYWLSGICNKPGAHLYTFEPNDVWRDIARGNLSKISDKFTSVAGTFEEEASKYLTDDSVDIAFIDAIHTSDFVNRQYAVVRNYVRPGGIVLFDDIRFSRDMTSCWNAIAVGPEIVCSAELAGQVGIVQL